MGSAIRRAANAALTVLLAGSLTGVFAGCATCPKPLLRVVDVDVLWTAGEGTGLKQGSSPAQVRVAESSRPGAIRIAMVEDTSLQGGEAWRASVWMAAIQASIATGESLGRWMVSVEVDTAGRDIDGPSAGGVLTAAIAVGLTGVPTRKDVALTGTINPDGSLGPVAGIPQKFRAAIANGKTKLGYPVGQRYDRDLATGSLIDLKSTFGKQGRQVQELRDVYDAYAFLSGRPLPGRLQPLPQSAMEPPEAVYKSIEKAARVWLASAQHDYKLFKALKLDSDTLAKEWKAIDRLFGTTDRMIKEGMAPAAYWRAGELFIRADSALHVGELLKRVRAREFEQARDFVRAIAANVERRIDRVTTKYREVEPRTVSDLMTLTDGMEALSVAFRSMDHARNELKLTGQALGKLLAKVPEKGPLPKELEAELIQTLFAPVELLILANVNAVVSDHSLTFRLPGRARGPSEVALQRVSGLLDTSARANLKYFEATTVRRLSARLNISEQAARDGFPDDVYQNARVAPLVVEGKLKPKLSDRPIAKAIAHLAGSLDRYIGASVVIAKHYSLALELDDNGGIVGVGREKALITMLTLAERMAREHAARAQKAVGMVPVTAQLTYQIARAYREGNRPEDKLTALEQFWRSSLFSQLAVFLSRTSERQPVASGR